MAATGEVNVILNAKGTALAVLKALQSQLANFQTTFRAGFNLNLGAQAANLLLSIPGQLKSLGAASIALAGQLKDQAEAAGVSTTALQVYRIALENAGGDAAQFDRAVAASNRAMVEARVTSSAAADAFRVLGLNTDRLARLSVEDRFDAIAKAVAGSKDPLAAFTAAGQILGTKNLPTLLAALKDVSGKGFDAFAQSASRAGQLMEDETIKRLDAAEKQIKKFNNALTIGVGEGIGFIDKLKESLVIDPKRTIFGILAVAGSNFNLTSIKALRAIVAVTTKDTALSQKTVVPTPVAEPLARTENVIRARIIALEQDRARIESSIVDTNIQKNDKVIENLDRQARLYEDLKRLRVGTVNVAGDESKLTESELSTLVEKQELEAKILAIRKEAAELGGVRVGRAEQARRSADGVEDPRENSNFIAARDAVGTGVNDYLTDIGSTGEQIAESITQSIGTAVQSISDGIYGWVTGAQDFAAVAQGLGLSVLRETLDTVVQIGVKQVINGNVAKAIAIGWKALTSGLRAADTTETIAAEAAKTPVLATNAALASASSFGIAAVVGIAALALAIGAFIGGFEDGGYTGAGGKSEPAGVVHKGEYVLTAAEVNRLGIGRIESFKNLRGYEGGGLVGIQAPAVSEGSSGRPLQIVVVDSQRKARAIDRNSEIDTQIVDIMKANRFEILG